jgi:hypothetical protein
VVSKGKDSEGGVGVVDVQNAVAVLIVSVSCGLFAKTHPNKTRVGNPAEKAAAELPHSKKAPGGRILPVNVAK